jgi:hypothetical protein
MPVASAPDTTLLPHFHMTISFDSLIGRVGVVADQKGMTGGTP